jgi:prepilin-type N-terminal cleavage/methylation domain-containing protein
MQHLSTSKQRRVSEKQRAGFTLVELMVSVSIFAILMLIITGLINVVYRAWDGSKRQAENSQDVRAVLALLEQDLAPAVVSDLMQFGQNPPSLSSIMPSGTTHVERSDSLFWWGPVTGTSQTGIFNLSEFGWYLTKADSPDGKGTVYNLNRYNRRFKLDETALTLPGSYKTADGMYWFEEIPGSGNNSLKECSRVVASTVVGFWVECLDRNGEPIPPRSVSNSVLRYNSGERFQMAPAGQEFDNGKSFQYTASSTLQAHALPSSVRVSVMLADELTLKRTPDMPDLPQYESNKTVKEMIDQYRQELADKKIQVSVFTTTVKLINAP